MLRCLITWLKTKQYWYDLYVKSGIVLIKKIFKSFKNNSLLRRVIFLINDFISFYQ